MMKRSLYAVAQVEGQRLAIYAPRIEYPTPDAPQIAMTLEVGDEPPIEYRERILDGEVDLGPDALAHTDAAQPLLQACVRAGLPFYRATAAIARAVEHYTQAERILEGWLARELSKSALCLRGRDEENAWEVVFNDARGQTQALTFASLRSAAVAFEINVPQPGHRPRNSAALPARA